MNLLLVTLDQFRGECLSVAGHKVVRTPNLDRLARSGVLLKRHYSQAAPCSPGRAALYTGTYQMNNRVVANGTPLDDRFDNLARAARRRRARSHLVRIHRSGSGSSDRGITRGLRGFRPMRACCRDFESSSISPMTTLRGFRGSRRWATSWLPGPSRFSSTEPDRPEEVSLSSFMTDRYLDWLGRQDKPWFAHLSYLRPHPPYAAAGRWASAFDPDEVDLPIAPARERHPFHDAALRLPQAAAPTNEGVIRKIRAQYYGMIGEVDAQLGRVWDALEQLGQWDDTFVLLTSDHGEQLGDHGLKEKLGFFEQSYHVPGIVRSPGPDGARGAVVDAFTENIDLSLRRSAKRLVSRFLLNATACR